MHRGLIKPKFDNATYHIKTAEAKQSITACFILAVQLLRLYLWEIGKNHTGYIFLSDSVMQPSTMRITDGQTVVNTSYMSIYWHLQRYISVTDFSTETFSDGKMENHAAVIFIDTPV